MPRWLARTDARWVMLAGMLAAALLLAVHGLAHGDVVLLLLRAATGIASAGTFVAGGLLAARLGQALAADPAHRHRGALVLGLYYGGTSAVIVASTLLVPTAAQWAAGVGAGGGAGTGLACGLGGAGLGSAGGHGTGCPGHARARCTTATGGAAHGRPGPRWDGPWRATCALAWATSAT